MNSTSNLPWAIRAANVLYEQMNNIDNEAGYDGQVEQSMIAERFTWTRLVSEVITQEYLKYREK